jgi:Flp pilus assembly protein TadB
MEAGAGHDYDERPGEESGETVRDESTRDDETTDSGGRFDFERGWMAVAVLLLVAAAALLYLARPNAAFVVAALGVSAWFINVRNGLKRQHDLVKRGGRNWEPRGRGDD